MGLALEDTFRNGLVAANTSAGARFFIDQLPQNPVYPCGTVQRVSDVPYYTQQAPGGSQASVGWARISVTVWCDGANAAQVREDLALAIIQAVQTFSCYDSVFARQAPNILLDRRNGVEPQTRQPLFKAMLDFRVAYQVL